MDVSRKPIILSEHTVALITLFKKGTDNLEDCWSFDAVLEWYHKDKDSAARQFVEQLEDHWTPAFMMALRREITRKLREHDQECGTQFAEKLS
ncbi:MAG TPA: hypothetical protein VLC51_01205 [Nitrospira sp.]|nr:hypothetical protein [Nitrospira sp.]